MWCLQCIWFLLISVNLLPVSVTRFPEIARFPVIRTANQHDTAPMLTYLYEIINFLWPLIVLLFLPLLFSPSCCSVLWRCCVWAWTSSFSFSTLSGFAAGDARVMNPLTPIPTRSSRAPTAAARPGASSSPHSSAGERLFPLEKHFYS